MEKIEWYIGKNILIAGYTRSGKSNFIELLVASILSDSSPQDVRLIIVDPKRVEFAFLNGVPHLLRDVVFGVYATKRMFEWLWEESLHRTNMPGNVNSPKIIVVIDEAADFMVTDREFFEDYIEKVTALSRLTGIFLIMTTSRISGELILTKRIRDCFTTRIVFRVKHEEESHLIIGKGSAVSLSEPGSAYVRDMAEDTLELVQMPYIKYEDFAAIVAVARQ